MSEPSFYRVCLVERLAAKNSIDRHEYILHLFFKTNVEIFRQLGF